VTLASPIWPKPSGHAYAHFFYVCQSSRTPKSKWIIHLVLDDDDLLSPKRELNKYRFIFNKQ